MTRSLIVTLFVFIFFSCQKQPDTVAKNDPEKIAETYQQAVQYSELGDSYYAATTFDSAYYYYNQSKALFETEHDSTYVAYTLIQMARIQQTIGDFNSSEETLTEALPYISGDLSYKTAAYNLFGISAKELNNYDDAVMYYTKILDLTKNAQLRLTPINNLATVYIEQKKYKEAIALLEPFIQSGTLDTLPLKKARFIDNLGFAYSKSNTANKGLELMHQALSIRLQLGDSYGSIASYLHLADFYKNNSYSHSKQNALQAYAISTKHNSINERLEALAFLMTFNEKSGENNYASQYLRLNDSIKKVNNNAKIQFAKIRYDSRKATLENIQFKEQRAATLLQLEKQKNQKYISFFSIVLLVLGSLYLVSYYKRKNKRERLAASYTTETRISKALHDELANDVFYAMNFAETQDLQDTTKKDSLLSHLDKIYSRTRNFSKENSPIPTGADFELNLKQMLTSYQCGSTAIIIKNGNPIDWSKVKSEKKVALYRVLQELMVNMRKHSQASFVVIGFVKVQNSVKIEYSDNGVGFAKQIILKNGLQNAENRILAVNGLLTFESETNKGFRAKIVIPK